MVKPEKVIYGEDREQYFLYYEPNCIKSDKVIFYIHGDGWNAGSPLFFDFVGQRFVKEGYRILSCGYRLSPNTKYPGQIDDCTRCFEKAMVFLEKKNIDNSKIIVIVPSAGGDEGKLNGEIKTVEAEANTEADGN